ncbi:molybdopterin-dependent oxidoreductase [Virgibacillus sp. NKC19-3]|uniref:molybdopterin-containing oxidoreductase family protein n=1 Tax=Virgibacillus saliphilus TaxID=2831674 RepID=UPI001C9A9C84|nr:molybdopterin-dependent oxidoreductase [Virgibacillus sp. NKC19-3]MBY7142052.1 molybdopterin-dependent oxidoreductase [Virgibacillus sp. NKC19-3]
MDSHEIDGVLHKKIKRRAFLKATGGAIGGATLATGGGLAIKYKRNTSAKVVAEGVKEYKTFRSTCSMECLHCNLTAFVKDGKLLKVEASEDFNVKGCLRGISRSQWVNHKERLKMPMLRTGEKGSGEFKEISWDEALDLIEENINKTIREIGNKGILLESASGNMDSIANSMAEALFSHLGGATTPEGSLCCSAVTAAMNPIVGDRYIDTRDTIRESKYIICWGNNPVVTMQAYFKEYEEAIKNGARMIVIDPRFSETAAKADEWVPIMPSTDTSLALGMLNIIIQEDLIDRQFLLNHTGVPYLVDKNDKLVREDPEDPDSYVVFDMKQMSLVRHDETNIEPALSANEADIPNEYRTVFDLIKDEAEMWTTEKTSEETEVPEETIIRLAREYAINKPAMIIQNMSGAQRTEYGTYVAASQFYLALITGNIGKAGAGVCDAGGATQFISSNPPVEPAEVKNEVESIPIAKLGEAIVNSDPTEIGFWYIMTTSPMTQLPNTNMVKKALEKVPFVVVADSLMTSTAIYADLILPVTTVFEYTSLMAGTRSHYVQLKEKAVDPPGQAKPDYWILTEIAKRFGVSKWFDKPIEEHIKACLKETEITIEQLKEGPVKPISKPSIPFENGQFKTSTGKAHLFVEEWAEKDYSPIVKYYRANECLKDEDNELLKKYPLMAIQRKTPRSIHSSFGSLEWPQEVHGDKPEVQIHPNDAEVRTIKDGDLIKVFNDRGSHKANAVVTKFIKEGAITLQNGWWEQQGGSTSYLTNDAVEPLGNGTAINNTLVEITKEV